MVVKNLKTDEEAMKPIRDFLLKAEYGVVDAVNVAQKRGKNNKQ